jgi:hypothetical protein
VSRRSLFTARVVRRSRRRGACILCGDAYVKNEIVGRLTFGWAHIKCIDRHQLDQIVPRSPRGQSQLRETRKARQ